MDAYPAVFFFHLITSLLWKVMNSQAFRGGAGLLIPASLCSRVPLSCLLESIKHCSLVADRLCIISGMTLRTTWKSSILGSAQPMEAFLGKYFIPLQGWFYSSNLFIHSSHIY